MNVATDDESAFHALNAEERWADREAARVFAAVCKDGRSDLMLRACDELNSTVDGWRLAMRRVGRMKHVSPDIRKAFIPIWVEKAHLPLTVGDRPTLARALRIIFGSADVKEPVRLYRGCGAKERRSGAYGFSWSTDRETARVFAEQRRRLPQGAVVLQTVAPAEAILLVREPEDWFDEGEVVVDPYRLGRVTVVERLLPKG